MKITKLEETTKSEVFRVSLRKSEINKLKRFLKTKTSNQALTKAIENNFNDDTLSGTTTIDKEKNKTFEISSIEYDGRKLVFTRPLKVKQELRKNGIWIISCDELLINGHDYDFETAWDIFKDCIFYDWDDIAKADDDILSKGAIEHKKFLNNLIMEN